MNFDLSPEELEFSDHFRNFCTKEIASVASEVDQKESIPETHYKKLGQIGYNGLLHKRQFGGQEASILQTTLAQVHLAEACGSTFFSAGASCGLFGQPIANYACEELKSKILPRILSGDSIGCLAVTEPDTGSDVSAIRTSVKKEGGRYLLSGQKSFITNAPVCDYAVVLTRLHSSSDGKGALTCFLVDTKLPGVTRGNPMKKMGLRASPTGELFFDNVELTDANMLGKPGQGFRIIMETFQMERLALSAYCVGVMSACFEDSRRYSRQRKSFGRIIAKHQSVAFMLADMKTKYEAAYLMLLETAWLMDKQRQESAVNGKHQSKVRHNGVEIDVNARASAAKLLSSSYGREVTNLAVQLHGGAGYMEEYRVCRMYRDIKIAEIGGGTSEIQKQIVAHAELKRVSF